MIVLIKKNSLIVIIIGAVELWTTSFFQEAFFFRPSPFTVLLYLKREEKASKLPAFQENGKRNFRGKWVWRKGEKDVEKMWRKKGCPHLIRRDPEKKRQKEANGRKVIHKDIDSVDKIKRCFPQRVDNFL